MSSAFSLFAFYSCLVLCFLITEKRLAAAKIETHHAIVAQTRTFYFYFLKKNELIDSKFSNLHVKLRFWGICSDYLWPCKHSYGLQSTTLNQQPSTLNDKTKMM